MPSTHAFRGMAKAAEMGGYAGDQAATHLWDMSKRELIEIALRFGERVGDDFSVEGAIRAVDEEAEILRSQKII